MATSEDFNKMTDNGFSRRSFLKLSATTVGAAAALGVVGCSQGAASSAASGSGSASAASASASASSAAKKEISFKDQNDYDVTVTVPCERMVVLQHHSLDMLCQLGAQENIVGIVDSWKKNLGDYMTEVFPGIDKLPTPGGLQEWNVEQIAELKPDVVIAASQAPEDAMQQVRDLPRTEVTRDALRRAERVVRYVTDGSGTKDMIDNATNQLKEILK